MLCAVAVDAKFVYSAVQLFMTFLS